MEDLEDLLKGLDDADEAVRSKAIQELTKRGSETLPALINILDNIEPRPKSYIMDPTPDKRTDKYAKVAEALGNIGDINAVPALKNAIKKWHNGHVNGAIALALSKFGLEHISDLVELLQSDETPWIEEEDENGVTLSIDCEIREYIVVALFCTRDRAAIPYLVAAQQDWYPEVAYNATVGLGYMGEEALPYLLASLQMDDPHIRFYAIRELEKFGNEQVLAALKKVAQEDEGETWWGIKIRDVAKEAIEKIEQKF